VRLATIRTAGATRAVKVDGSALIEYISTITRLKEVTP
jgi:hypothetical protein